MGLKPWEFARLTPSEFTAMVEGYRKRQEQEWYRTAWLACYVLAPHSKRKLTPEKLLGRPSAQRPARRIRMVVGHEKPEEVTS
jgi:hypothetical protein